jgi:hypothetical protein
VINKKERQTAKATITFHVDLKKESRIRGYEKRKLVG